MNRLETESKKNRSKVDKNAKAALVQEKKAQQAILDKAILSHRGTPRTIRIASVVDTRMLPERNGEPVMPKGINWMNLRNSRKIAEFFSDFARTLGIGVNQVTFDKTIIKWKSEEILRQICLDGFLIPIDMSTPMEEKIVCKHYRLMTA